VLIHTEGKHAQEHWVNDDTDGPHVAPLIIYRFLVKHFGRDVQNRTLDVSDAFRGVEQHWIAKIYKLYLAVLIDYYVVHFNVSVTYILFVAVVDREQ